MSAQRLVQAYVDLDGSLMVQVHPCYPAERARMATPAEWRSSQQVGGEGWIETLVSERTMRRLDAQAEG